MESILVIHQKTVMQREIKAHHRAAIENLVKAYQDDAGFHAIIIGGSVAKGCAREDSDIDFMIVATKEEYQRRVSKADLFINRTDLCNYPGGFVDGKIINLEYLQEVADKGNEPSRAAFDGAFIVHSNLESLETILSGINTYPEEGRKERMKSFYCMSFIQNWLMGEAERHGNLYTKSRAASQLALHAGRLILAHNRVLFPYHKWFMHYLEKCKYKPLHFTENINQLLSDPTVKNAKLLFNSVRDFKDWGVSDREAYMWFMTEVEWSWRKGTTPLEDL